MKVALVHDDLVQWGGAERVLAAISEIYPEAPIFTSLFNKQNPILEDKFRDKELRTSFLQRIPGAVSLYKVFLPLYPVVFESFDFSEFDLVISHTTRFAKSIVTNPKTIHICYCHTPPRFLWNFSGVKTNGSLVPYLSFLRLYDLISARRVDYWIAGSLNSSKRIKKVYKKDSDIVLPFVDTHYFKGKTAFDGGYYMMISRLNKYKNIDLVIDTFNSLGIPLKIVGKGSEKRALQKRAYRNIEFFEDLSDEDLSLLVLGCRGMIIAAEEDFGMVSLEALAAGKKVIAYGRGGVLETIVDGKTGWLFYQLSVDALSKAIERAEKSKLNKEELTKQQERFSKQQFKMKFKMAIEKVIA